MAPLEQSSSASHGDLFPLPLVWDAEPLPKPGLSRGVRQRVGRRRAHASTAVHSICALNELMGCCHTDVSQPPAHFSGRPSHVQSKSLSRVWDAAEPPSVATHLFGCTGEAQLQALLCVDSTYGAGSTGDLASFGSGEVSLPGGQGVAVSIFEILDGEALDDVLDIDGRMLWSSEELEGVIEGGLPNVYHDPVLKHSESQYLDFIRLLYDAGIIRFDTSVKCQLGCFFVRKKNGKLRLVIDARRANAFFRVPPTGANSSSSTLGNLRIPKNKKLWVGQYDVKDFFYRIGIPAALGSYFGLPPISSSMFSKITGVGTPPGLAGARRIFPVLQVLPMGFSWSFYLAQEALRCIVARTLPGVRFLTDFTSVNSPLPTHPPRSLRRRGRRRGRGDDPCNPEDYGETREMCSSGQQCARSSRRPIRQDTSSFDHNSMSNAPFWIIQCSYGSYSRDQTVR